MMGTSTPQTEEGETVTRNHSEIWLNPLLAIEHIEEDDEITFRYVGDDGKAETPDPSGSETTVTGTITKIVDRTAGGIWVDANPDKKSSTTYKLHLIEGGTVTGTNKYGNRSVRHGLRAKVRVDSFDY